MRPPSRFMPKYTPPPITVFGWMGILLWVAVMGWAVFQLPWWGMGLIVVGIAVMSRVADHQLKAQLTAWAAGRGGDSMCTFAKSFPRREVDTWVIRAVYEQLQAYLAFAYPQFPIRAEDGLNGGLITDADDLDLDVLAKEIAVRTGRSLVDAQRNPYYGKVETVRDLVLFFNAQPGNTCQCYQKQ